MDYLFELVENGRIKNDRIDDVIELWKITLLCKYGSFKVAQNAKRLNDDHLFDDLFDDDDLF